MHLHFRTVCGKLKKQATHGIGRGAPLHTYKYVCLSVCVDMCAEEDGGVSAKALLAFVKMYKNKNSKKNKKKKKGGSK